MSHRHQVLIIARVGDRYRLLAGLSHIWLYGQYALNSCLRCCKIFQADVNREALQTEISLAQRADAGVWDRKAAHRGEDDHIESPPFPFIMSCLFVGAFSLSSQHDNDISALDIRRSCWEFENNDGLTIIDVSILDHVRYCFLEGNETRNRDDDNPSEKNTPLSAQQYLRKYYDNSEVQAHGMQALIDELFAWSLLSIAALKSTWPAEAWPEDGYSSSITICIHRIL